MKYGYARVSTRGQAKDGNSLEAQKKELVQAGADIIYSDTFTGTKMERPEFDKLQSVIKKGDMLVVTKLDRLGRSVSQASKCITEMLDNGVNINVLNLGILTTDSVSTLLRNVLLSFAQFERDMIIERTQEGKAIAKVNNPNYREGRKPAYSIEQLNLAMEQLKTHSYTQVTKMTGISRSTLLREHNKRKATNSF